MIAVTHADHAHDQGLGQTPIGPIRRLFQLFSSERRDIVLVIMFSVIVGVLSLATPVTVQALVNFVSFGGLIQPLVVLGILLFGFLTLAGMIRVLQTYVVEVMQRRLFVRVVADLTDRLPRVTADCYDRQHGPELVNRFFDVVTVQKVAAMLLLDGATVLLQMVVGLLILAFYHPFLLAFDAILVVSLAFVVVVLGRGAIQTSIRESKAKYAVAAALEEIARHPLAFKLSGAADFARRRADLLTVDYIESRSSHFVVVLRQIIGFTTLQVLAATALLTLGGWLVLEGQLTLGQLVAAELIVSALLVSFSKFGKQLEGVYDLLAAVDKLGQLMDLPLERESGHATEVRGTGGTLAVRGVTFAFDPARPVLRNINLTLNAGERVGIAASHGAGKSLLADLLIGLRRPNSGHIELGGVDLRELCLAAIRDRIAVVRGSGVIEGSIEENVCMGRASVTPEAVRAALIDVGLLDEIRTLPDSLATQLSASGAPLSAGQIKRLMIARAVVGRPDVIVLDDVLDDLDSDARDMALNALLSPDHRWTVLILGRHAFQHPGIHRVYRLSDLGDRPTPAALTVTT